MAMKTYVMRRRLRDLAIYFGGIASGAVLLSFLVVADEAKDARPDLRASSNYDTVLKGFDAKDGSLQHELHTKYGEIHRLNAPAVLYYRGDVVIEEYWYVGGVLDRQDGPAVIRRDYRTGQITEMYWYSGGRKFIPQQREVNAFLTREIKGG